MAIVPQMIHSIASRTSTQPRTILGFLFGIFLVLATTAIIVAVALVGTGSAWLIGLILLAVWLTGIGLLVGVMRQASKDPTGLQVGQLSGSEYESLRRLTLGDSLAGEHVEGLGGGDTIIEGTVSAPGPGQLGEGEHG